MGVVYLCGDIFYFFKLLLTDNLSILSDETFAWLPYFPLIIDLVLLLLGATFPFDSDRWHWLRGLLLQLDKVLSRHGLLFWTNYLICVSLHFLNVWVFYLFYFLLTIIFSYFTLLSKKDYLDSVYSYSILSFFSILEIKWICIF